MKKRSNTSTAVTGSEDHGSQPSAVSSQVVLSSKRKSVNILNIIRFIIIVLSLLLAYSYIHELKAEEELEQEPSFLEKVDTTPIKDEGNIISNNDSINDSNNNDGNNSDVDKDAINDSADNNNTTSSNNMKDFIIKMLAQSQLDKHITVYPNKALRKKGKLDPRSGTVAYPCGINTTPQYKYNMADMYGSSYSQQMLEKCLNLPLPLKHDDPKECWPNVIIMASFPTNGNGLARLILQNAMKLLVRMDHYNEAPPKTAPMWMYNMSTPTESIYHITSPCKSGKDRDTNNDVDDTSFPLPIMGKPAIIKSHHRDLHAFSLQSQLANSIHGVVRLARNPGDQILRNYHRWSNQECRFGSQERKESCFRSRAKSVCPIVIKKAKFEWLPFHEFWNKYFDKKPQIVYHYEQFSDSALIEKETKKVLEFLNYDVDDELGKRIDGLANEVTYKQGTLMADICGKDAARTLHQVTKHVTEKIGYVFDHESATWSVQED